MDITIVNRLLDIYEDWGTTWQIVFAAFIVFVVYLAYRTTCRCFVSFFRGWPPVATDFKKRQNAPVQIGTLAAEMLGCRVKELP